jgi:hypothetical protein
MGEPTIKAPKKLNKIVKMLKKIKIVTRERAKALSL